MKLIQGITAILLFFWLPLLNGQINYTFLSNVYGAKQPPPYLASHLKNSKIISLGDTENSFLGNRIVKKLSTLGNRDFQHMNQNGRFTLEDINKKRACPGPIVQELDDQHVIISFNSNWFIDEDYPFVAANEDCDYFNQVHMLEALEETLEDYQDWNKIIITHHPIQSISELNGQGLSAFHFLPLYGQLYTSYRKNIGHNQAIPRQKYQRYIHVIGEILEKFDRICFISGHDKINTVIQENDITYLNINTGTESYRLKKNDHTLYASRQPGLLSLRLDEGNATFVIHTVQDSFRILHPFQEREEKQISMGRLNLVIQDSIAASEKYHASGFQKLLMGKGYRDEWLTKVKAPLLNINDYDGGMAPYAIGGGLQTMSIKFKSAYGKKYAFRVLDKQPEKSLGEIARESIYRNIVQELITTMHPYGPLVADQLLNATDILHVSPQLYILNDHPSLIGKYKPFIGKLGSLEEKPKGSKNDQEGFHGADEVVSTYEMLLKLRKSPDHRLDPLSFAKARLADMYLGDWDRHEDNWKWAMYEEGEKHIYHPIPKDRDHVFSRWTGWIPGIADIIIMNAENFDYHFGNLRHLNFKARYLDRQLAAEIDLQTWIHAAKYLHNAFTDEVIDQAVKAMPPEVYGFHGEEIRNKLKSRRNELEDIALKYYRELNKEVKITGTNKKDFIYIHHMENGNVDITIYADQKALDNDPFYHRIFEYDIIDRIYVFGLDGGDTFEITGKSEVSIPVSIIGGEDHDKIEDASSVKKGKKTTVIYDSFGEDIVSMGDEVRIKRAVDPPQYDPYAFNYDYLAPIGSIRRSSGNGWGYGGGFTYYNRGFNKDDYKDKWDIFGLYYPELDAYRIEGKYTYREAIGLSDFYLQSRFSTLYDKFPFFYGIGNNTPYFRSERKKRNRIDYDILEGEFGLQRTFYEKSTWTYGLRFERHKVLNYKDLRIIDPSFQGYGLQSFIGAKTALHLDFTDHEVFPTDGSTWTLETELRADGNGKFSGNIRTRFAQYKTIELGTQVTFIGALQYLQSWGDAHFYHLSILGSQTHLRGFTRNRFLDKYALSYNTEMRVNLGSIRTPLIRFHVGLIGFYDGGRVWNDSSEFYQGEWNNSIGGGFYISPGSKEMTISYIIARPDDNFTYSKLQFGFDF